MPSHTPVYVPPGGQTGVLPHATRGPGAGVPVGRPDPTPGSVNQIAVNRNPSNAAKIGDVVPLHYGTVRVEGKLIWQDPGLTSPTTYDFYYLLGHGEIEGPYAVRANGVLCWTATLGVLPGVTVTWTAGTPTQGVANPPFTSRMPNMAWLKLSINTSAAGGGHPNLADYILSKGSNPPVVSVDLYGCKVYDPHTGLTAFHSNAAMVIRDFLTHSVHGCGLDPALFADSDWSASADQCGFSTIDMSITQQAPALSILEQMRLACNGTLYQEDGLYKLFIDRVQSTVVIAFDTSTNCHSVNYSPLLATDAPSRVIIQFTNNAANFTPDSAIFDAPGAPNIREAIFQSQAISSMAQGRSVAAYKVNVATYPLRVTFIASWVAVLLARGDLITLTTDEGLSVQKFVVEDRQRTDTGEYKVSARVYLDAIYSSTAITGDTPMASILPDPFAAPPDVTGASLGSYGVVAAVGGRSTTQNDFAKVTYTPPVSPAAKELRVRLAVGSGAPTATWAGMAGTEIVVPLTGNLPPSGASSVLFTSALVGGTTVKNFTALGGLLSTVTTVLAARVIVRVMSTAGVLSSGVTLDRSASSTTTTAYSPIQPYSARVTPPGILSFERPRTGTHATGLYGAAYWSGGGTFSGFTAANMNDGSIATTGITLGTALPAYVQFDAGIGNVIAFGKVTATVSGNNTVDPNRPTTYYSDDALTWYLATSYTTSSWVYSSPNTVTTQTLWGLGPHRFWAFGFIGIGTAPSATTPVLDVQFEVVDYLSEPNLDYYEVGSDVWDAYGHMSQLPLKTFPAFVRGLPVDSVSVVELMKAWIANADGVIAYNVNLSSDFATTYIDVVDASGGRCSPYGQVVYPYLVTP